MALEKDRGASSRAGSTGRVRRRSQLLRSSDSPSDHWGRCARPGRICSQAELTLAGHHSGRRSCLCNQQGRPVTTAAACFSSSHWGDCCT